MIKKITLITLFVLFAALLIGGGIYRTSAKEGYDISLGGENIVEITQNPENAAPRALRDSIDQEHGEEAQRQGQGLGNGGTGQGRNQKEESTETYQGQGQGQGSQGQGQGQGSERQGQGQGQSQDSQGQGQGQGSQGQGQDLGSQGQGQGNGRSTDEQSTESFEQGQGYQGGQGRNQQSERPYESAEEHETVVLTGIVLQAPANGVDMIVNAGGQEVLVGTGPGYLAEQGFMITEGDSVELAGFWEDGEFKPQTITIIGGPSIMLRDENGRPMWSGAGRRANSQNNQDSNTNAG